MPTFTPASFDYYQPHSIEEAMELVRRHEDSKLLAGGQSLLAMMKLRILQPKAIIDISRIPGMDYVRCDGGYIRIGAMTTHAEVAGSQVIAAKSPLLHDTARTIADTQVRNLGTMGGSISHADPSANYLPTLLALDAEIVVQGERGERTVAAKDFFLGPFQAALETTDIVKEVRMRETGPGYGHSFRKLARREQEFAIAIVSCLLSADGSGTVKDVRVALGAASTPARATRVEKELLGKKLTRQAVRAASNFATEGLEPASDVRAGSEYRMHLARVVTNRALLEAAGRAGLAMRD